PDLMRRSAEAAQDVHLALVGARQLAAVAHPHHLGSARFASSRPGRLAGNMGEVLRLLRIGDVDDRGAVVFRLACEGIGILAAVRLLSGRGAFYTCGRLRLQLRSSVL